LAKQRYGLWTGIAAVVLIWVAIACNASGYGGTVTPSQGDGVTVTFFIDPTLLTLTPVVSATDTPSGPTPLPTITPTNTPGCGYWSEYIDDITIPDGAQIQAGAEFTKTWRIRNNGCLAWPPGIQLGYWGGDQMGGPDYHDVDPVGPGTTVDISIPLIAPDQPGEYLGRWQLITPDGVSVGPWVTIEIVVIQTTPTATPTATATPDAATPFVGTWENQNSTGRIVRVRIRRQANSIYAQMWSKDSGGAEVNWGEASTTSADVLDGVLTFTWTGAEAGGQADRTETQSVSVLLDGRLRITGTVNYTDPLRSDFNFDEFFRKVN
jgi:hypothetical protein